ncbi:hypothetical protein AB0K02_33665, partial [Streptomyces sp. NPDC049597]|uniref:hypothetical protein n=1 Tax=Streptomyces sp. NPDC049597 TaxID=3155276 RepID=UPI00341AAB14
QPGTHRLQRDLQPCGQPDCLGSARGGRKFPTRDPVKSECVKRGHVANADPVGALDVLRRAGLVLSTPRLSAPRPLLVDAVTTRHG